MADDRAEERELRFTHEFLSVMLGVRRAGVTVALNGLEAEGLIRTSRGTITILDRERLATTTNGFYGGAEAEARQVLSKGRRRVTRSRVSDGPSAAYDPQAAPGGDLSRSRRFPRCSQDIDQDQVCSTRGACGAVPALAGSLLAALGKRSVGRPST
jgi:hypothetical protein